MFKLMSITMNNMIFYWIYAQGILYTYIYVSCIQFRYYKINIFFIINNAYKSYIIMRKKNEST